MIHNICVCLLCPSNINRVGHLDVSTLKRTFFFTSYELILKLRIEVISIKSDQIKVSCEQDTGNKSRLEATVVLQSSVCVGAE